MLAFRNASAVTSERELLLRPRSNDCSGWHCLTGAEQFGIIFSIVVTSIILTLAYMYYLGRITSSHQEIVLARRRQRRGRRRNLVPSISMGRLPVLPQFTRPPPQVVYHPVFYSVGGNPLSFPQTQGPLGQWPQPPVPMVYPVPPVPISQPQPPFPHLSSEGTRGRPLRRSSPASSRGFPPRQPTWRQRFCRAIGLPLGTASTITSSTPETLSRLRSRSTGAHGSTGQSPSGSRRGRNSNVSNNSRVSQASPSLSDRARRDDKARPDDTYRAPSPGTDVATVHSDDYDLTSSLDPVPGRECSLPPSQRQSRMGPQGGAAKRRSSMDSDGYSDERHTIPTVSSIRPAYDAGSRPLTPIPREMYPELDSDRGGMGVLAGIPRTISSPARLPDWASYKSGSGEAKRQWASSRTPGDTPYYESPSHQRELATGDEHQGWNRHHRGRDVRRTAWDRWNIDGSHTADDSVGPCPPRSIHQGGGGY